MIYEDEYKESKQENVKKFKDVLINQEKERKRKSIKF